MGSVTKLVKVPDVVKTLNCALGSATGELSFFQYQYGHASSALEIHPDNVNPKLARDGAQQLKVPSYRLDEVRGEPQLDAPVLLKMDVQGAAETTLGVYEDTERVSIVKR